MSKKQYLGLVSQNDKDGIRYRGHGYPFAIFENLQTPNIVLDEKGNGTHVRVGLQTKREVRLWARRVITHSYVLIEFPNCVFNARCWQAETVRDQAEKLL